MTIAAYVRVSTVGQNEAGQVDQITRWANGNGINPGQISWYVDKQTGDTMDRPEFLRLQGDIFAGKVETVVLWKLDRLSRKLTEGITTLGDWCDRGLRVVSVTQQIDFSGTVGRLIAAVLLAVAEMEQETRKERQRAGIEAAKKRGVYKGRKAGSRKGSPKRVVELRHTGLTDGEIASSLGICRRTVQRYLRDAGLTGDSGV